MTNQNSPYNAFATLLSTSGHPCSPAELHGVLLGRSCTGVGFYADNWLADVAELLETEPAENVRNALDVLRGAKNTPITMGRAISITESQLRLLATPEPQGPGVLTGNATSPAYMGITAASINNVLAVSFQCSPVLGVDFIPVTIFAVPFAGSATA